MNTEPIGSISEIAMELTCPFCKAAPGEKCVSKNGGMDYPRYKAGIDERNRRKAERFDG